MLVHRLFVSSQPRILAWSAAAVAVLAFAAFVFGLTRLPATTGGMLANTVALAQGDDWIAFGRTPGGDRFAPAGQITPDNVGSLEVAWTLRTGDTSQSDITFITLFAFFPLNTLHTGAARRDR